MNRREFDDFSFKAQSSEQSESQIAHPQVAVVWQQRQVRPADINFRHVPKQKPAESLFNRDINQKISSISEELQQNIRRRLELEKTLTVIQGKQQRQKQREVFLAYSGNKYKESEQVATQFREINDRADQVEHMVAPKLKEKAPSPQHRARQLQQIKRSLLQEGDPLPVSSKEHILIPIVQTLSAHRPKPLPVYTVPDQIKIQKLLRKLTFPEVPAGNLQLLCREAEGLLAVHQPHSDIHYLLMVGYFHSGRLLKVRRHFEEIILFKVFNVRAYWVAVEAQFGLECWESCLRLSEECMQRVGEAVLPRLLYLKARCYQELGNYVNSIVCYNQLLKLKPKISEYYLERGLLYHRVGYYREAKEDMVMFGVLRPDAEAVIKERILGERSETRRKEYIALLAKLY